MNMLQNSLIQKISVITFIAFAASASVAAGGGEPEGGLEPCPDTACTDDATLAFETLAAGSTGGVTAEQYLLIETREEFAPLWRELHRNRLPAPEVPKIDFESHVVLGAFLGERPTGGYGVEIRRVCEERIVVERRSPPADAMVTQALTAPYHLVVTSADLEAPEFCEARRESGSAR
jgi:hypothetical protein